MQTYTSTSSESDITVPVRTLKTILTSLSLDCKEVSHIKIDIDGYEPAFFVGNASFFELASPLILTEFWSKGLTANKKYPLTEYWEFLVKNYFIILCNYPSGDYILLGETDFKMLSDLTNTSVANLLLIPKTVNFDLNILGALPC